ncbi:hypothetical protein SAMN05216338_107822 [Bradyrhizobium sp. Rc2d]|nr:hypothetical protein SAMN05216338_107822 [Bradyrhizobium sp. Rc2d]
MLARVDIVVLHDTGRAQHLAMEPTFSCRSSLPWYS